MTANDNPILEMRRKKSKKKKKFMRALSYILVFAIGVGLGYSFTEFTFKKSGYISEKDSSVAAANQKKAEPKAKKAKSEPKKSDEQIELEKLSQKISDDFEKLYPSADLSFYIENLKTGEATEYNNHKMNSASFIKLFIMQTVYDNEKEGEKITDDEKEKLKLMITESDNKAANYFIDKFGGENEKRKVKEDNQINLIISESGYKNTELNRKMHDTTPPEGPSGYENYTCVKDVVRVLKDIYNHKLLGNPYDEYMFDLLKNQKRKNKIPKEILKKYPDVSIANKTGELAQVENDAAVISGKDYDVLFVIMVDNISKKPNGETDYELKEKIQQFIADTSLEIVDYYENKPQ